MAGVSELENYVAQLSQSAQLDSAGQFTLDLSRSALQMSALARTQPHRWAFFLTQAGVAGGATAIHLSSGLRAESVTLEFAEGPDGLSDARLLNQQREGESAFVQLVRLGLQWALAGQSQVDLVVETPRGGYCLSGDRLRELPGGSGTRLAVVRVRPAEPWWKIPFGRAKASLGLLLESRWRLAYCPVPVKFDGLTLSGGRPDHLPEFRKPLMVQQLHWLPDDRQGCRLKVAHPSLVPAVHYVLGDQVEERPLLALPVAEVGWLELVLPQPAQMSLWPGLPREGDCTLGSWSKDGKNWLVAVTDVQGYSMGRSRLVMYYHGRSRDQLHCQRYGLLCDPVSLPTLQTDAWSVVWADDEVQVDPTGLTPIHDEYLSGHIERVERSIRRGQIRLGGLQKRIKDGAPRPIPPDA